MNYENFKEGDIITDFRKKPARWGSLEEWISRMCHTYRVISTGKNVSGKTYNLKSLDHLTATESSRPYETWLPVDVKTYHDYRIWNKDEVEGLYEQMKIEWEVEKVEIEKERIEQEIEDEKLRTASDETIKKFFDKNKYEEWGRKKRRSIKITANHFKRDLMYVWDLIERMHEKNSDEYGLDDAGDYDEVYKEVIMEWFLSQEDRSIRELAKKYFDYDLEETWNFIEEYDHRSVDEYDAEDYDEVAEENGYVDEEDEDYPNEKAERLKKRLEKKEQNKMLLIHSIYDTPADKGGLGLNYNGLDVKSRQELYKFLGGKKIKKTKNKKEVVNLRNLQKKTK